MGFHSTWSWLVPTVAGLERWDRPMLGTTVHLEAGYDSRGTPALLADRQLAGRIARRGAPAPVQAGRRWVIERTHAWMSTFGRLRRCPDRHETIVTFDVYLATAIVTTHCPITAARTRYRWSTRPTTRRLKYCLMPGALSHPALLGGIQRLVTRLHNQARKVLACRSARSSRPEFRAKAD